MKEIIISTSRNLRKRQTPQEKLLWEKLRNRNLSGKKFLRQFPIPYKFDGKESFFVADFYCSEAKLIIEIDGKIHEKQKEYDKLRDDILSAMGFNLLRFNNEQIEHDIENVLIKISKGISPSLMHREGLG